MIVPKWSSPMLDGKYAFDRRVKTQACFMDYIVESNN